VTAPTASTRDRVCGGRSQPRRLPATAFAVVLLCTAGLGAGLAGAPLEPRFQEPEASGGDASSLSRSSAVRGRVHGPDGAAVGGAAVTVTVTSTEAGAGERVTRTDAKGRFVLLDVPPGTWPIRVSAPGFLPSEGIVRGGGKAVALAIELRSIDEGSPHFAEGDPQRMAVDWLERGNALLDQGRTEAARAEYERAFRILPPEGRSAALRAVARTYWLERRVADAVRAIEEALLADHASSETAQLYRVLMGELGRQADAERFLADLPTLAAAAAPTLAAAAGKALVMEEAADAPAAAPPSPVPAVAHRVGDATVRGTERHPWSNAEELARRYGTTVDAMRAADADVLAPRAEGESFDLFVPEAYHAGQPWGVVVWVSAGDRGGLRSPQVRDLLAERRLLWVGANGSGNRRSRHDRVALALDALHLVSGLYDIDEERVFVAGYSGGGRMASHLAFLFPELFRGGVFWFGVDYFRPLEVPYRPGHSWAPGLPAIPNERLENLRRHGRFALVTGQRDFNRSEMRAIHQALRADHFAGAAYFEIPAADHYHGLDAEWLGRALAYLEGRG
jgi:dienelactone hydrolase